MSTGERKGLNSSVDYSAQSGYPWCRRRDIHGINCHSSSASLATEPRAHALPLSHTQPRFVAPFALVGGGVLGKSLLCTEVIRPTFSKPNSCRWLL